MIMRAYDNEEVTMGVDPASPDGDKSLYLLMEGTLTGGSKNVSDQEERAFQYWFSLFEENGMDVFRDILVLPSKMETSFQQWAWMPKSLYYSDLVDGMYLIKQGTVFIPEINLYIRDIQKETEERD